MGADICEALGRRVRELRRGLQWRQIDLAEHSGLGRVYISDLERGKVEICLRNLQVLAISLGTSIAHLVEDLEQG